jgi:hypothetical protein
MWRLLQIARLVALAWKLPAAVGAITGMVVAAWQYVEGAHWLVASLAGIGATTIAFGVILVGLLWLQAPAGPGIFTSRKLQYYAFPIWKLSWNFDNFLGGRSGAGSPVVVTSFQPRFKVNRGKGIRPKSTYIQSDRTGQRAEVLIECGNPYVQASEIEFMPPGKWYHCRVFFGDEGLTKEQFFAKFDGFEFVFEYDETDFRRYFPRHEIEAFFDEFWRYSNQPSEPKPRLRQKHT